MEAEIDVCAEKEDVEKEEGEEGEDGEDEVRLPEVVAKGEVGGGGEEEQGNRGDDLTSGRYRQWQTVVPAVDEDDANHEESEEHEGWRVGECEAGPCDHRVCQQTQEEAEEAPRIQYDPRLTRLQPAK